MQLTPWKAPAILASAALGLSACGASAGLRETPPQPGAARPAERELRFRASAALSQDTALASGQDVCGRRAQLQQGFACFRENGTQYHGTPIESPTGNADGVYLATTRVWIGLDHVLGERWTLGARGGLVVRGASPRQSGASAPPFQGFHGELRAAYWLGPALPLALGPRVGVFASFGTAQIDAAWNIRIEEDLTAPRPSAQPFNPPSQTLSVYRKSGTGFAGGGAVLAWAFSPRVGLFLELHVRQLFPSPGTAFSPTLGVDIGL